MEAKAQAAEDLQARLNATEEALRGAQDKAVVMKKKIDRVDAREADLIKRFDAQSEKFGDKFSFSIIS